MIEDGFISMKEKCLLNNGDIKTHLQMRINIISVIYNINLIEVNKITEIGC